MTAITILDEQHEQVLSLARQLTAHGAHERAATLDRLTALLQLHTRIEETIFYPAIASESRHADDVVLESYEEHTIVDGLLARLATRTDGTERFLARARVLQSLLEEHIGEEREHVFPLAERLGDARLDVLGARMAAEIDEVERLHAVVDRAAGAARRTEDWAGRVLDAGFALPRRAVRALAPTRLLRLQQPPRRVWVASVAQAVPKWVVDGLYSTVVGDDVPRSNGGRASRSEGAPAGR